MGGWLAGGGVMARGAGLKRGSRRARVFPLGGDVAQIAGDGLRRARVGSPAGAWVWLGGTAVTPRAGAFPAQGGPRRPGRRLAAVAAADWRQAGVGDDPHRPPCAGGGGYDLGLSLRCCRPRLRRAGGSPVAVRSGAATPGVTPRVGGFPCHRAHGAPVPPRLRHAGFPFAMPVAMAAGMVCAARGWVPPTERMATLTA